MTMMYHAYQAQSDLAAPLRLFSRTLAAALNGAGWYQGDNVALRAWAAANEVFERMRLTHARPPYKIDSVPCGDAEVPVLEETLHTTPFATLLRFKKAGSGEQPRLLLVAPMSGHFATLLRETIRTLVQDHDVYLTDWHNARDIPWYQGRFGLDEYVEHVVKFLEIIGPGAHLMAVCQPCVPALAAVALMAQDNNIAQPRTLSLLAGPVDARINPTAVNELAMSKPFEWFETKMIHTVPWHHRGAMRRVYPGFLQLTAFMSMNLERHLKAFIELYKHLLNGEHDKAEATKTFYEEYFAVADLPAEFYLETISKVFQEFHLAQGRLKWRGQLVEPRAIRRTAIFTVEGERDDICSIGQTLAAQDLCDQVRPYMKTHHVQVGVGHYGVFSGRRWRNEIYPKLREVVYRYDANTQTA